MNTRIKFYCFFLVTMYLFCHVKKSYSQTFQFQTTETNALKTASDIKSHGFPDTLTVRNYNWFYTTSNPTTWGNAIKFKSNHSIVKFYINHAYPKKVFVPYSYKLCFHVLGYSNLNDTTQSVTLSDTLTIHYNPDSLSAFQDIQIKKYSAFHKVTVVLDDMYDITDPNNIVQVNISTLNNLNFNVEALKLTQVYDKSFYGTSYQVYPSNSTASINNDFLDVKWCLNNACTNPQKVTPCSYELEWTYVDNFATGGGTVSASQLNYDFKYNSTRIWLDTNFFKIPITYSKGYIAYRVRMVRPDSVEFRYPIYSNWSEMDDQGTISSLNSNHYYQITSSHLADSLNWQYTISFAEQGKFKHVLSYFDGLLKNRQSITRFNSNPNRLIATSSIFDYEGRPAIQILPTPIGSSQFRFKYGMTLNSVSNLPYRANDFDQLYNYSCPVEGLIAPLSSSSLPNLYYSPLNSDTANYQKYVPDAEGYPMVQTKFEPGYADRIEQQGGAGLHLQLGNGHIMHNDYLSGEQTDLNMLFGVNAGYDGFYRKTVTKDPNGQLSLQIADYEGKQVASTLVGNGPDQNSHAIESLDSVPQVSYHHYDLLLGTTQSVTWNKKTLDKMYYMDVAGMDTIRYKYIFTPFFTGCDGKYLSVKANYDYYVADKCGVIQFQKTGVLGTTGVVGSANAIAYPENVDAVSLDQGKQYLHKELTFNSNQVYAAVDSFLNIEDNCLKNEPWFIKNAVLEREFPCPLDSLSPCEQKKKQMMQELYPGAKYGKYFVNAFNTVVDTTNNSIFSNLCDTSKKHNLNYSNGNDTVFYYGSNSSGPWLDTINKSFVYDKDSGATCYKYRYLDTCIVKLPTSISKNGIVYSNFWNMSQDTFIYIFNDSIAEALLPLHPEYCKLNNCFVDTFKERYIDVPDYSTAQMYDFDYLQSIIDQDPIVGILTAAPYNFPSAFDSLARFGGQYHIRLDTFVMTQIYCGCNDTAMLNKCINEQFNYEIYNNILVNDYVKKNYLNQLREMYLQNRERYVKMLTGYGSDSTCGPCSAVRMKLIPAPIFQSSVTVGGGISPIVLNNLSAGMSNLLNSSNNLTAAQIQAYQDSSNWVNNFNDSILCFGQIDSIVNRLANCNNGNTSTLNAIRTYLENLCSNNLVSNGNYTPEQIHDAIQSSGASFDEYCNPYMVNYDALNTMYSNANQQCLGFDFYTDIQSFLSRTDVKDALKNATSNPSSPSSFTLSTSNQFEDQLHDLLNTTAVRIKGYYNSSNHLYTLCVYEQSNGTSQLDTVKIYIKEPANAASSCIGFFNNLPGGATIAFNTVSCITNMFPNMSGTGYINSFSFGIEASITSGASSTTCKLIGWSDSIETMKVVQSDFASCVPCTQMRSLYTVFKDTLSAYGIVGIDHPCYEQMLRSFMNHRLGRMFATDDYNRFIESCALADFDKYKNYVAYSSIKFTGGNHVNPFLAGLNSIDPSIVLYPILQYASGASDTTLLFDYMGVPRSKLHQVRSYFNSYTGAGITLQHNVQFNPAASSDYMGLLLKETTDTSTISNTVITSNFTYSSPVSVGVYNGATYKPHYMYYVYASPTATASDVSYNTWRLHRFIYDSLKSFYFFPSQYSTVDYDYDLTAKKDYLAYAYQSMGLPPYNVLDTLREDKLMTYIPSYSTVNATYSLPFSVYQYENLYLTNANSANASFQTKLKKVIDTLCAYNLSNASFESPFYFATATPQHRNVASLPASRKLDAYLCGDGSYWIRYFGSGDTLYNIYMRMPKYIHRSQHKYYKVTSVTLLPGENQTRYFKIQLQHTQDPTKIVTLKGLTDFVIGQTTVLDDVLLSNSLASTNVPNIDTFDNCERQRLLSAIYEGKVEYQQYRDSVRNALYQAFLAHVTSTAQEEMSHGYKDQRFLFTLYYYDRAGNLIRTVPPQGVKKFAFSNAMMNDVNTARASNTSSNTTLPDHKKISYYDYNSINKIVKQQTPDGGETSFFYDHVGRLIFSQNAKQNTEGYYTYTLYDRQNRIIETGQSKIGCNYFTPYPYTTVQGGVTVVNPSPQNNSCFYIDYANNLYVPYPPILLNYTGMTHEDIIDEIRNNSRKDVVLTIYDTSAQDLSLIEGLTDQQNLRKRVACVKYFESIAGNNTSFSNYTHATHYSYDISGNVNYLVQDMPELDYINQRYKRIDYDYDVISGKVNLVSYNRSFPDQYYHRYSYDADNRITKVETSNDAYLWKRDASYQYYQHGPLARAEVGDLRVQGVDFAYTIQGWLKAVNGDTIGHGMDMGEDGNANSIFPRDASGLVLDYYVDDYKSISGRPVKHTPTITKSLYNGNIAQQTTAIQPFMTLNKQYVYDQLNRIKRAEYNNVNVASNTLTPINDYKNKYTYDMDGNILKLTRMGNAIGTSAPVMMDTFNYTYYGLKNQLKDVTDQANDVYDNDIKKYTTSSGARFVYDATGNIIKDLVSKQDSIEWNLYNKVTKTRNDIGNNELNFTYDGTGNRVAKHFVEHSDTGTVRNSDYYVRDASGNILAVYHDKQMIKQKSILDVIISIDSLLIGNMPLQTYLNDFVTYNFAQEPNFSNFIVNQLYRNISTYSAYLAYNPSYYMLRNTGVMNNMIYGNDSYLNALTINDSTIMGNAMVEMYIQGNESLQDSFFISMYAINDESIRQAMFEKMNDTLLAEVCNGLGISVDPKELALQDGDRLDNIKQLVNTTYNTYPYSVSQWMRTIAADTLFVCNNRVTTFIKNTLYQYRDDSLLATFFDNWSNGTSYLQAVNAKTMLYKTVFDDSTTDVLNDVYAQQGKLTLDSAIATTPSGQNFRIYLNKWIDNVNLSVEDYMQTVEPIWWVNVIEKEHFNLAEHHLYGSARLGIKGYWPNQLYSSWDYSGETPVIDTVLLHHRQPWYSAQYQDAIVPDALQPWASTYVGATHMQSILGQKQYEVTDHLGNVMITASDKKYPIVDMSDSSILAYHAELPSTYDYYPFGMLMPGRYTQDTTTQCATVTQTIQVPQVTTVQDDWQVATTLGSANIGSVSFNQITFTTDNANDAISVDMANTGLLKENTTVFTVASISSGVTYMASMYEYNLNDTILLASQRLDRAADYSLQYTPNGSGVMKLVIAAMNNSGTTDDISLKYLFTTVTTYTSQTITSTICNTGGDRYRFGFNGQEKTNEIAGVGNHNTALYWEYDTRLARRWNIDPVDQISISNYACFGNNPIYFVDILGNTIKYSGKTSLYDNRDGERIWNDMVSFLKANGLGADITQLEKSGFEYKVVLINKNSEGSSYDPKKRILYIDPNQAIITNTKYRLSPLEVVIHEIAHAADWDRNPIQSNIDYRVKLKGWTNLAEKKVIQGREKEAALKIGGLQYNSQVTRNDHGGVPIYSECWRPSELCNDGVIEIKGLTPKEDRRASKNSGGTSQRSSGKSSDVDSEPWTKNSDGSFSQPTNKK